MATLMAFSEAVQTDLALLGIFAVVFPAIVTGCIIFAAAQAASERQQNAERKHGRNG
jgi:O-acetyl-ADP-ribose deacetylase (regulator of RNase III)